MNSNMVQPGAHKVYEQPQWWGVQGAGDICRPTRPGHTTNRALQTQLAAMLAEDTTRGGGGGGGGGEDARADVQGRALISYVSPCDPAAIWVLGNSSEAGVTRCRPALQREVGR